MFQENYYKTLEQYKNNTLVIKQKDKSQNNGYKKTKLAKFSKNKHFWSPDKHIFTFISGSNTYWK